MEHDETYIPDTFREDEAQTSLPNLVESELASQDSFTQGERVTKAIARILSARQLIAYGWPHSERSSAERAIVANLDTALLELGFDCAVEAFITDTERLDFIEAHGALVGRWIARDSTRGRGFRLYSGTSRDEATPTAREAIDAAIAKATGKD